MTKVPLIAIVGRANVGKSSVFNRLVGERRAIVAREPGTTRDAIYGQLNTDHGQLDVVDTAGLKVADDEFEASIQEQIVEAAAEADLLLVVVDATTMLTEEDRQVAKLARKSGLPAIVVANKSESKNIDLSELASLGISAQVNTSASQNRGFADLIQLITDRVKPVKLKPSENLKLALVGRPNVGKSSIFNALLKRRQATVDAIAGTTRDVSRFNLTFEGRAVTLMDTAGIRRPGKIKPGIEKFSVLRAIRAIDESDVVIVVLDATEPAVALDQKLAGLVKQSGKGLILAINKWDLIEKNAYTHDELMPVIKRQFQHVPWASFSVTSASSGQNMAKLLEQAVLIDSERRQLIKTAALNRWLGERVAHHPPAGLNRLHPKLKYVTQTGTRPPEFSIFGRNLRVIHWSYKRYLERELRSEFGFNGTPINIKFSEKDPEK